MNRFHIINFFLILVLMSCSTSKYHTIKEVLVKVDKSYYTIKNSVADNKELKRGIWAPANISDGEIIEEQDNAVVLQTIGKINWKWPIWWLGTREYADVNKATIRELDIGIKYNNSDEYYPTYETIISNASTVNYYSEPDAKIDYSKGLIPVWNSTYWGISPANIIEHFDRMFDRFEFVPQRTFSGNSSSTGVICQSKLAKNENNGCISIIAAKKYNSIEVNADVLYKFSKLLYERDYCSHLFIGYELLFDSLELRKIADLNKFKSDWHSIASFTQSAGLYEFVTMEKLNSLPNYYPNDETHKVFIEGYKQVTNTFRGGYDKFNFHLDSILFERLKYLPNSLDSISKLLAINFNKTESNYSSIYDNIIRNTRGEKIKYVIDSLSKNDIELRNYLNSYNNLDELIKVVKDQIDHYRDWCNRSGNKINEKSQEVIEKLDRLESSSLKTLKQNNDKHKNSSTKLKIEKYIQAKNTEKLDAFIDSLLALQPGSLLKFTPYYIDYIDERTDKTNVLINPIVLVKKISNIDRKSLLVKVLHLPIPNGFNSQYIRADYSLKPEAEVVLPISEFEGYPGSSSINQMNNFIDSIR